MILSLPIRYHNYYNSPVEESGSGEIAYPTPPFTDDNLAVWYDPSYTSFAIQDETGITTTQAVVRDLTENHYDQFQGSKVLQPVSSSGLVNFTGVSPFEQQMRSIKVSGLARNVTKIYYGAVIRLSSVGVTATQRQLFQISKAAGTSTNRFSVDITGNSGGRAIRTRAAATNGGGGAEGTEAVKTTTAKVTADTWTYIEGSLDCTADTLDTTINGITNQQFTSVFGGTSFKLHDSDPLVFTLGNTYSGGTPFIGDIRAFVLLPGGLVDGAQQTSIRSYLASRRDAA